MAGDRPRKEKNKEKKKRKGKRIKNLILENIYKKKMFFLLVHFS